MSAFSEDKYVMLISSLPSPNGLFKSSHTPLSRIKLEQRLSVLSPAEHTILASVEKALDWRFLDADMSDEMIRALDLHAISSVRNETLSLIIRNRLEMRTLIAATRMRHNGKAKPSSARWGFGRWQTHIINHWQEADFALSHLFPWINEFRQHIENDNPVLAERLILTESFKQLQRLSHQHRFDFEAVVIYVLKWNILDRSLNSNGYQAQRRFEQLVKQGLGQYRQLFTQEAR
ncbi:DUF2764 family protein [Alteromonas facilis]|uniref:DUF2764 family protein n=1 Tax=Alteromonas facilis TaxID=2048004 RepID=UPI000C288048|nr:DUF2764 family protein [Alteromonas facilis]